MKRDGMRKHRSRVVKQASGKVLEIGFGSGLNLPYYENISELVALDPSLGLFEMAQESTKSLLFPFRHVAAGAEKMPFEENSFDSVLSTWNFCSIEDPEAALKEIFRVLKPGGKFIFIEHGLSSKNSTARIQKILTPLSRCLAGGCHLDREIDKLIQEAGFSIERLEKFKERSKPLAFMYEGVAFAEK